MPFTKNPLEVANIVRTKTLYVNSHLSKFDAEKGDFPLMVYDMNNYSRYEFVLINEDKKCAVANIPLTQVWRLQRMTDHYYGAHLDATLTKTESNLSAAYTVQLTSGNMKGKTPAQILMETADGEEAKKLLRAQYSFLQKNLSSYPRNQKQMDAILDAVRLFEAGQLSKSKTDSSGSTIVLYDAAMRTLRSKRVPQHLLDKNPNFKFVYDMKIEWALGAENAVTVTIINYFAPVLTLEDGRLNVLRKEADRDTGVKIVMNISADEWADILHLIDIDMRRFEMLHAKESYAIAMKIDEGIRAAYRNGENPYA